MALPEYFLAEVGVNEQSYDAGFTTPGVTFLAASGDEGIYGDGGEQVAVNYPSASPNVVSVGGTSIVIDSNGDYPGTGTSGETAWGDGPDVRTINGIEGSGVDGGGGGGLSDVETEPAYQSGVVPTSMDPDRARALPDVSMDSGSTQAYDVFTNTLGASSDSDNAVGWLGDAGTSAASPIWAGLIAIADQGRVLEGGTPLTGYSQTLPALYSLPSTDFHDITYGNNGDPAEPGYDLATGLGTPVANLLVPALAGYEISSQISIKTEPPSTIAAGNSFTVAVQVTDSVGNPVSSGSVTVDLGPNPVGGRSARRHPDRTGPERRRHLRPVSQPGRYLYTHGDRQQHPRLADNFFHYRHNGDQLRHQYRRQGQPRCAGGRPAGHSHCYRERPEPRHRRPHGDSDLRGGIYHPGYAGAHERRRPGHFHPVNRRDENDLGLLQRGLERPGQHRRFLLDGRKGDCDPQPQRSERDLRRLTPRRCRHDQPSRLVGSEHHLFPERHAPLPARPTRGITPSPPRSTTPITRRRPSPAHWSSARRRR